MIPTTVLEKFKFPIEEGEEGQISTVVAKWPKNLNEASVTSQLMQENASSAASLNFPPPGNYLIKG